jgi:hypothetical protein
MGGYFSAAWQVEACASCDGGTAPGINIAREGAVPRSITVHAKAGTTLALIATAVSRSSRGVLVATGSL